MTFLSSFSAPVISVKFEWHFSKVNPRFKNREATQGEFFACDTPLRSFIREAIQNSLDAKIPGSDAPVAVRIFLSGDQQSLPPATAKRYFKGGWPHFCADGSGLRNAPQSDEPCRFLVYEDSGTTGLTGDVDQFHEVAGRKNPFYYFFRAEGQSNKLETGRGRWGLGKFVFPRSSRIRSFFALTVRYDDGRRLLVGQSILRSHHVDGKSYTPDGWFGEKPGKKEAPSPVEDADFADRFERDFCLERGRDPGLSVVIPFCDSAWDAIGVASSVIQDYFSAIMNDELVVTVEGPDTQLVIQSHSIIDVLDLCGDDVRSQMQPLLDLALWARQQRKTDQLVALNRKPSKGPPRWSAKDLVQSEFTAIRRQFITSGRIALRIPVSVQARGRDVRDSHFDVFLQRCESTSQRRPIFIREGIVISNVRSRLIRDVSALVMVDDAPLATFLGDAENPAHTEWQEEISHFKGKYVNGAAVLRFVRNTVPDLCQLLAEETDEQDSELLLDVFSIGPNGSNAGAAAGLRTVGFETRTSRTGNQSLAGLTGKSAVRRGKPFRIARRKGGFRISGSTIKAGSGGRADTASQQAATENNNSASASLQIEIQVAYDRRSGSALRNFSPTDFHLAQAPLAINAMNVAYQITSPNSLKIMPNSPQFQLTVSGFDINRDLFVKATQLAATATPHEPG